MFDIRFGPDEPGRSPEDLSTKQMIGLVLATLAFLAFLYWDAASR